VSLRLETERLILRPWKEQDREAFAAMNADPVVMAHFPKALDRAESDALLARLMDRWRGEGIAFGAAERRSDGALVGMVGLARVLFPGPVEGAVEIGWRLARAHWGRGYATEAAQAWLAHGFAAMRLREVVSFTVPENRASRAVMERLGMTRDPLRDFLHPNLPEDHPLRAHMVWSIGQETWRRIPAPARVGGQERP
jgi:ribosomal-protein-alanine N-acetyltransferase